VTVTDKKASGTSSLSKKTFGGDSKLSDTPLGTSTHTLSNSSKGINAPDSGKTFTGSAKKYGMVARAASVGGIAVIVAVLVVVAAGSGMRVVTMGSKFGVQAANDIVMVLKTNRTIRPFMVWLMYFILILLVG
jgi:hypothetical protein